MNIQLKPLTRKKKYLYLTLLPTYFLVTGLFLQPLPEILNGIYSIIKGT